MAGVSDYMIPVEKVVTLLVPTHPKDYCAHLSPAARCQALGEYCPRFMLSQDRSRQEKEG